MDKKILVHAINGIGLGHLARTITIAKDLREIEPGLKLRFITNSKFTGLLDSAGFEYDRIGYSHDDYLQGRMAKEDFFRLHHEKLLDSCRRFSPDAMIFDTFADEAVLRDNLENGVRNILVLRKMTSSDFFEYLDSPATKYFHLILIPHSRSELEFYGILKRLERIMENRKDIRLCSPVVREFDRNIMGGLRKRHDLVDSGFNVLVCSGGGDPAESDDYYRTISSGLNALGAEPRMRFYFMESPLGGDGKIRKLNNRQGAVPVSFEPNQYELMSMMDLVISQAGYNTANEIISLQVPSIVIPKKSHKEDQLERARWMEKKTGSAVIKIDDGRALAAGLLEGFRKSKKHNRKKGIPASWQRSTEHASVIKDALSRKSVLHLCTFWLNMSEQFIHDEIGSIQECFTYVHCLKKTGHHQDEEVRLVHFPEYDSVLSQSFPRIGREQMEPYNRLISRLSDFISRSDIRILHAQYGVLGLFYLPLLRKHDASLVVNFRGHDLYKDALLDYSPMFAQARLVLARSDAMMRDLVEKGCPGSKIVVHHSGIDTEIFMFLERKLKKKEDIRFLSVCDIVEKKGMRYAIEAFALFAREHPDAKFTIIGDGPLLPDIRRQAAALGIGKNLMLLGPMDHGQLCSEMHRHHVFILPSVTADNGEAEGIPVALMEAMATGMPVISTFHKGIPELVEDGRSGLLVKERDSAGLYAAMKKIYAYNGRWKLMGRKGRDKVEKDFNIRTQAVRLQEIYKKVSG